MNVGINIHPYELPLICPLQLGGEMMETRSGWLVEVTDGNGRTGWGEIAPLPGMSSQEELNALEQWDGERVEAGSITPSVRCGLDMALFNLGDPEIMPKPLRDLKPQHDSLGINALLIGTITDMLKQEQAAAREGYRTIKIKVGRQDIDQELRLLHTINAHAADEVQFRLDANRSWTPNDADRYLSVLTEMNVEYVEEPFADPRASLAWSQGTGVPMAFDESLRAIEPETLKNYAGLRAVILKPTLLGGFCRCVAYANAAREIGAYPVISAMLESGVGIISMARFAACLTEEDVAAGLDTYRWIARDVLHPRPSMSGGRMAAETWDLSRYRIQAE